MDMEAAGEPAFRRIVRSLTGISSLKYVDISDCPFVGNECLAALVDVLEHSECRIECLHAIWRAETENDDLDERKKQLRLAACEGSPSSLIWTIPFGQEYSIDIDLDFSLDAGNFPLAMELSGGSAPSLGISWDFTLGFGFDEKRGFFLSTEIEGESDDGGDPSELAVQTWFTMEDKSVDARLFFLKGWFRV